jgi:hypothetical protein
MTTSELFQAAETLQARLAGANGAARVELQPSFHRIIQQLNHQGARIPCELRQRDATLTEEWIEAQYDNMPG